MLASERIHAPAGLAEIVEELQQVVSISDLSQPLQKRVRTALAGVVDKYPDLSFFVKKVRFLYSNRQLCLMYSPTLKQVFVLLSNLEHGAGNGKSGRVKNLQHFDGAILDIGQIYAEYKRELDDDTGTIVISSGAGRRIAKALERLFPEIQVIVREPEAAAVSHSMLHRLPMDEIDMDRLFCSGNLPNISSMTIDTKSGFALFRTDAREVNLSESYLSQEIAEVLYFAYEYPNQCTFSLDHADPGNLYGRFLKKVYDPPDMEGTMLGSIMWMADWKMKQMTLGEWYIDDQGILSPINDLFQGIKSSYEFRSASHPEAGEMPHARLWFVVERVKLEVGKTNTALTLKCKEVKIGAKAVRMVPDPTSATGLKDIETAENDPFRRFADYLTENFDRIYPKLPSFEKVRNLAILRSFADYIRDVMKVPKSLVKPEELKKMRRPVPDDFPRCKIPQISTMRIYPLSDRNTLTHGLVGGVDLTDTHPDISENLELSVLASEDQRCIEATLADEHYFAQELEKRMKGIGDFSPPVNSGSLPLFQVFVPTVCSAAGCKSVVCYDLQSFDGQCDASFYAQKYNNYSFYGQVYCVEHHPRRCHAEECGRKPPLITVRDGYITWNTVTFHKDCWEVMDKTQLRKLFPQPPSFQVNAAKA